MDLENFRREILEDLDVCLEQITENELLFYPRLEKVLAKAELFTEESSSNVLRQLILFIRGKLGTVSSSEISVGKSLAADIQQLRQVIATVVPQK